MDDSNGTLAALKVAAEDEKAVKFSGDLQVGDIVYQNMDRQDGLILNNGYDTRYKIIVIVGKQSNGEVIAACLINSKFKGNKDGLKFQYIIKKENYPDVEKLVKDSPLNCSKLFTIDAQKSIKVKAQVIGHLTCEDEINVINLVSSCDFISDRDKKRFHIGEVAGVQ